MDEPTFSPISPFPPKCVWLLSECLSLFILDGIKHPPLGLGGCWCPFCVALLLSARIGGAGRRTIRLRGGACLPATPNYLITDSFPDGTREIGFCCGCLRRVTQAIYPENFFPCVYCSIACYKYCVHCTLPARQMRTGEKEFLPRTCD